MSGKNRKNNSKTFLLLTVFTVLVFPFFLLALFNKLILIKGITPVNNNSFQASLKVAPWGNDDTENYVDLAIGDLAGKTDVARNDIKGVSVEKINFNDTSLGCPQKNKFYIQVITPGFLIYLNAKGSDYIYHAGLNKIIDCFR